ncbi:hypothetical protein KPL74_00390 [Bacillus sp. NP157]|nr:hypothetical protein KPL74_00390 [Bacillus sp. NP157]
MKSGSKAIRGLAPTVIFSALIVGCHPPSPTPDRTRESDVLEIIWGLRQVRAMYGEIPETYATLEKHGLRAPVDPVRRDSYEYARVGSSVTVCARFDEASPGWDGKANRALYGDPVVHGFGSWIHGIGRQCLTDDVLPKKK